MPGLSLLYKCVSVCLFLYVSRVLCSITGQVARRDDDDNDDDAADAGLSVAIVLIIAFTIGLAVLCVGLIFIRR